jgi:hypothetical protein
LAGKIRDEPSPVRRTAGFETFDAKAWIAAASMRETMSPVWSISLQRAYWVQRFSVVFNLLPLGAAY